MPRLGSPRTGPRHSANVLARSSMTQTLAGLRRAPWPIGLGSWPWSSARSARQWNPAPTTRAGYEHLDSIEAIASGPTHQALRQTGADARGGGGALRLVRVRPREDCVQLPPREAGRPRESSSQHCRVGTRWEQERQRWPEPPHRPTEADRPSRPGFSRPFETARERLRRL